MFIFQDKIYLWGLVLIPLLILLYLLMLKQRKGNLKKFGDPQLLRNLMPDYSALRPLVKFGFALVALLLLIVMIARPQFGSGVEEKQKRRGIETIIAMDISNSMWAEDVRPSRIQRSKMLVSNLMDKMTDDKVGLIIFAGEAFVQMPITADYVSGKIFLDNIQPGLITTQGTDIAGAIDLAMKSFTANKNVGKAIILITDGENHEEGALEAAKRAAEAGMHIFILGVGSTQGAPIRLPGSNDYKKDNSGNVVMTKLNEDMCRQIAAAGKGSYIHIDNSSTALQQLSKEFDTLAKGESEVTVYNEFDEQFQAFALLAFILLLIEMCILEKRFNIFKSIKTFLK
jgi:Ca-activated chloride channel family protein